MLGALIVGICRAAAVHLVPQLELFVIYAVMALVLVFRPYGLFSPAAAAEDLTMLSRADLIGAAAFVAAAAVAPVMPAWLVSLATIAFANALVVLGLIILWRDRARPVRPGAVLRDRRLRRGADRPLDAGARRFRRGAGGGDLRRDRRLARGGILLARYREIFFAMLSLAMSMILYGMLVKTETLGSTDGFHVAGRLFPRLSPAWRSAQSRAVLAHPRLSARPRLCSSRSIFAPWPARSPFPMRDNEIRLEFLGVSVNRLIHLKLVIAATLAGVGGALAALSIAHVDPNMAYWTTSGGFVFVTILAGTASVAAAFVASFVFELVRSIAVDIAPNTWQIILGAALLLTILFLPEGLGSLLARDSRPQGGRKGAP